MPFMYISIAKAFVSALNLGWLSVQYRRPIARMPMPFMYISIAKAFVSALNLGWLSVQYRPHARHT
ncbi:hypothetical protein ASE50_12820 [Sphingomonas sp. Leaf5]|nr:hypothetical protein ASE50_12820 [Sphingomonas sp. Leaf5]